MFANPSTRWLYFIYSFYVDFFLYKKRFANLLSLSLSLCLAEKETIENTDSNILFTIHNLEEKRSVEERTRRQVSARARFEGVCENSKKSSERRTRFWGCGRPCVHRSQIRSKEVERNEGFRGQLCHPLPKTTGPESLARALIVSFSVKSQLLLG